MTTDDRNHEAFEAFLSEHPDYPFGYWTWAGIDPPWEALPHAMSGRPSDDEVELDFITDTRHHLAGVGHDPIRVELYLLRNSELDPLDWPTFEDADTEPHGLVVTTSNQNADQSRHRIDQGKPKERGKKERKAPSDLPVRLGAFLDDDTIESYDWVVPDLLDAGDRFVYTGGEGDGKSTLFRQFGLKCAAGIHPTTSEPMDPIRVLHVDLENGARRERRALGVMVELLTPDQLTDARVNYFVRSLPEGFDLSDGDDQERLWAWCELAKPRLLLVGPRYKMLGNEDDASQAQTVMRFLDAVRVEFGCAIGSESHSPHKNSDTGQRVTREYGTSKWLRWPEFGMHLRRDGEVSHFRSPREPERKWPASWQRNEKAWKDGTGWPWEPMQPGVIKLSMATDDRTNLGAVVRAVGANPNIGAKALEDYLVAEHGSNAEGWRKEIETARRQGLIDHQVKGVAPTDPPGKGKTARYVLTDKGEDRLENT